MKVWPIDPLEDKNLQQCELFDVLNITIFFILEVSEKLP
jgi:hypothetical protein